MKKDDNESVLIIHEVQCEREWMTAEELIASCGKEDDEDTSEKRNSILKKIKEIQNEKEILTQKLTNLRTEKSMILSYANAASGTEQIIDANGVCGKNGPPRKGPPLPYNSFSATSAVLEPTKMIAVLDMYRSRTGQVLIIT